jgi:hypothetical protein
MERGYAENLLPKPYTWFITGKGLDLLADIESGVYDAAILSDHQRSMILAIEAKGTLDIGGGYRANESSVARALCVRGLAQKGFCAFSLTPKGKAIAKTLRSRAWVDARARAEAVGA